MEWAHQQNTIAPAVGHAKSRERGLHHVRYCPEWQHRHHGFLEKQFVKSQSVAAEQVSLAVKDSYKRLLKPSMESEVRVETKQRADMKP